MDLALSIDLGTSGCRCAVFDDGLRMLACAKTDYPLIVRSETEIDQDAEVWWQAVRTTAREVIAAVEEPAIRAISICSQGLSVVPVDANGHVLHSAISWLDTRATRELERFVAAFGRVGLRSRTGLFASPLYSAAKVMWMWEHLPDVMDKAHAVLLPMDFILLRLTGRAVTNYTMANGTMFYSAAKRDWDDELLSFVGMDREMLPVISKAGSDLGPILPEVAKEWGLVGDVRVAVGAQDQKCAAYGAGVSESTATASLGTASCISRLITRPYLSEKVEIPCFSYLYGDMWDLEGIVNTAGSSLKWFRDTFAPEHSFERLDGLAEGNGQPSGVFFTPYLAGSASPRWSGGVGMFYGLTLGTGVGQCARAVLEGVAYHIRENLDAMDAIGGRSNELRLFGGGAVSDLWCRIIADVVSRPVARMASYDTALIGAARLAFESIGIETAPAEVAARFEPDSGRAGLYEEAYGLYMSVREKCYG